MQEFDILRERVASSFDYDVYKYLLPHIEAVEKRIEELEDKLSEMKATINKMEEEKKSFKRWRAENGGEYYYIKTSNEIIDNKEYYDEIDNARYSMGNYYKTKEEAERARDLQLAIVRVNDAIDEANEGWVADYNNKYFKHIISYNYFNDEYDVELFRHFDCSFKLKECKTKEIAERIINEFTSELNLIFNVK